jgi:hypothetical protein
MKGQGKRWSKNEFARDGRSGASLRAAGARQWIKKERAVYPTGCGLDPIHGSPRRDGEVPSMGTAALSRGRRLESFARTSRVSGR